jgi:hypothetical protein
MFPGDLKVDDLRTNPMLQLRHSRQIVRSTAHANNQHYRQQYTDQANKDRQDPGPNFQPGQEVWARIHERVGKNPKLQPQWERAVIIGHGPNANSFKVRKIDRARKQFTTVNVNDLKPRLEDSSEQEDEVLEPRATRFAPTPLPLSDSDDEEGSSEQEDESDSEDEPVPRPQVDPKVRGRPSRDRRARQAQQRTPQLAEESGRPSRVRKRPQRFLDAIVALLDERPHLHEHLADEESARLVRYILDQIEYLNRKGKQGWLVSMGQHIPPPPPPVPQAPAPFVLGPHTPRPAPRPDRSPDVRLQRVMRQLEFKAPGPRWTSKSPARRGLEPGGRGTSADTEPRIMRSTRKAKEIADAWSLRREERRRAKRGE